MEHKVMIRVLIFGMIITSAYGCRHKVDDYNGKSTDSEKSKVIQITDRNDKLTKMSDIIKGVRYIKLQEPSNKLLGHVDKVILEDGKIFIFDYFSSRALFVYDYEGNYKFSISGIGQGPGEFTEIKDCLVTENSIEILNSSNHIIVYDLDGNFKYEMKLPFHAYKFSKLSEDEYIIFVPIGGRYDRDDKCNLMIYNFKTNDATCLLKLQNEVPFFTQRNILIEYDNDFYFSTVFNDTIYSFDQTEIAVKNILDFGNSKFPVDLFNSKNLSTLEQLQILNENTDKMYHTPSLFINDDYLITEYSHSGTRQLIYNKKAGDYTILSAKIKNDVDGGLPVYWMHALNNNEIVSVVESNYLIEHLNNMESESTELKVNDFVGFARNLSVNDPHVLIFYQLK